MHYKNVISGRFLARPNRFIAHVETTEGVQICHVKNTGRCRELLVPGATVYLEPGRTPGRSFHAGLHRRTDARGFQR